MDNESICEVVAETGPLLVGRAPGKIFQLSPLSMAIDFGLRQEGYLLLSVEPSLPRMHLIKRRVRDLEKQSTRPTHFALALRKELSGTTLRATDKEAADRIVHFRFSGADELGRTRERTLVAQLTGRSANLFLLDENGVIVQRARLARVRTASGSDRLISGQVIGEPYRVPSLISTSQSSRSEGTLIGTIRSGKFSSPSEAADAYFTSLLSQRAFLAKASAARADLRKKIARHQKLLKELQKDLATHAAAEEQKRIGDLLLANVATAKRDGNRLMLIDYFAEEAPTIEVQVDQNSSLPEEASRRFALYSRSKRARNQITSRIKTARTELEDLESQQRTLEKILAARDEAALDRFGSAPSASARGSHDDLQSVPLASAGRLRSSARHESKRIPGTRRYISSDGCEILVGRTARDNDHLTFKAAKPNDLWLHAADYGGSHVVIRNPTRKDLPHRAIIEAAQLAAHFSQARKDPKVDVRYTQRKFLSKPKGAAPGLVRLSRFKNITVEPRESLPRAESA